MQQPVYKEEKPDQASKTHADSSQTYSCSISDKEFSRPDHRKRHEAAHSYSLTRGVCGQYFNRLNILAHHRAQQERPEAKQRPPMKRIAAPEPGPVTKQRRTMSPPAKTPMVNPVVPDVLPEDPETRVLYIQHWKSIRTEEAVQLYPAWDDTVHLSRDGTVPVQTADHSLQDQPVFWFYPAAHWDWSVAVLPC